MKISRTVYPDSKLSFNSWSKRLTKKIYGMHKTKIEKEQLLTRLKQFENLLCLNSNISNNEAKEYIESLDTDTICFNIRCFPEDKKELLKAIEMYKRQ